MNASVVRPITINAIGVPRNAMGTFVSSSRARSAANIAITSVNTSGDAERAEKRRDKTGRTGGLE